MCLSPIDEIERRADDLWLSFLWYIVRLDLLEHKRPTLMERWRFLH
jgi:hypothetical protein